MESTDFASLFEKYLAGQVSPEETDQILALLKDEAYREQALQLIESYASKQIDILPFDTGLKERLELRLRAILKTRKVTVIKRFWWAAAAILVLVAGGYFLSVNKDTQKVYYKNDILPGGNKATLTLGNGNQIILDTATTGKLAQQGNTNIIKTDSGRLAYNISKEKPTELFYNVLTTPRGGQYQLQLPDGSQVWLNASSSIRYPTTFTGRERTVEMVGEVYFEVVYNSRMPFHVKVNNIDVAVLGTHFNINSYTDETDIKTTLLEGSIKLTANNESTILMPGQQAQVGKQIKTANNPDLAQVMAWKNGVFNFNKLSLQEVMRQLSRWYDVDVVYEGNVAPKKFGGEIQRDLNLSEVLEGLQAIGVHFKIDGKKLIVMP